MLVLKCLFLIFIAGTVFCQNNFKNLFSDPKYLEALSENPKKLFKTFYNVYEKSNSYDINSSEGVRKFNIFKENLSKINEMNLKVGKKVYGITPFADLSKEEFRSLKLMSVSELEKLSGRTFKQTPSPVKETFKTPTFIKTLFDEHEHVEGPTNKTDCTCIDIDWLVFMNSPRDSKSCKASWAFAIIEAFEIGNKLANWSFDEFSQQYLIDCDSQQQGCTSGWPGTAWNWVAKNGSRKSAERPFLEKQGNCQSDERKNAFNCNPVISSCDQDTCGCYTYKSLLVQGPIVSMIDASSTAWRLYKPLSIDIPISISNSECKNPNHAVVIWGMKSINGKCHLLGRNSWGSNWGANGDFSISIENHCFSMDYAWHAKLGKCEKMPDGGFDNGDDDDAKPDPIINENCATFYSDCNENSSTSTLNLCGGIKDTTEKLNGPVRGFTYSKNAYALTTFSEKNCLGSSITVFESQKCFKNFSYNSVPEALSVARRVDSDKTVLFFNDYCSIGPETEIRKNISDLTGYNLNMVKSMSYTNTCKTYECICSIILFSEVNFQGKTYGFTPKVIQNIDSDILLKEWLSNAKSLSLVYCPASK